MNFVAMRKHFVTVCRHKAVVFRECHACGITWRGIVHDLSKFSLTEFVSSAEHFQGNKSPIEAEKECCGYSLAWQHHMGHNPHHWEYWIDYGNNGEIIANKMPYEYVVEMICDWIGAGQTYSKEKWTQKEPLDYFYKVRSGRYFHPDTEKLIFQFLICIADKGLDEFHKMAKCEGKYAYLSVDYKGKYIP